MDVHVQVEDRERVTLDSEKETQKEGTTTKPSGVPSWAQQPMAADPSEPRLQKAETPLKSRPQLDFAEPSSGTFEFISQVQLR